MYLSQPTVSLQIQALERDMNLVLFERLGPKIVLTPEGVVLEDICPCGPILPPRHLATWRFLGLVFSQSGLEFKVSLEAGGWEIIKKYVALGMKFEFIVLNR